MTKSNVIEAQEVVVEVLPNITFKVKLKNNIIITAIFQVKCELIISAFYKVIALRLKYQPMI